jgi:fluoroacetyl-CoA thioesterase
MKPSLVPGLTFIRRIVVDLPRTIAFMGEDGRVYATPALVSDAEYACRDFLLEHLDAGEDSVGTRVAFDHLAATPLGMTVEITVTLAEAKGRLVVFEVTARDPVDEIARGQHARFVVDVEKTKARLRAKSARVGGGGGR